MTRLALHRFGDGRGARLVCAHGVTAFGGHFADLAARLGGGFDVLAPDLLGHGDSPHEPPWSIDAHVQALLETVGDAAGTWLGHSFGARLAIEVAARRPELVERLVLLDPAVWLPPHVARFAAENSLGVKAYDSIDDAVERRWSESMLHDADPDHVRGELERHLVEKGGLWRYRYEQAAVVTAFGELAAPPPPFTAVRVPTLIVLGQDSYLTYEHLEDTHRDALGDLLEVVAVPGGHTLLWDAPEATAAAVASFLHR